MRLIIFFSLTLMVFATAFTQPLGSKEPLVSLDMESMIETNSDYVISGMDTAIAGIEGRAIYFVNRLDTNTYLRLKPKSFLNKLWQEQDFSIEIWAQTKRDHNQFEVIASNKDWNSGEIRDFTTNHEFGFSRASGHNKGWALICQPDGSWAWNIGDGKYRLDYRPTAPRQQINDGAWHQIVFTISRSTQEAYLYFDGLNVAIYNLGGIMDLNSELPVSLATDPVARATAPAYEGALDEFNIYDYVLDRETIAQKYISLVPASLRLASNQEPVKQLNLMSWNIWHGGRRHGREIGPKQVIDFIKDTDTDIVMMQETYGSGPLIADALGYYFYLASTNISVMSKYPIVKTKPIYDAFRCGYTTIELSPGQKINLASLWIHYLPAWRRDVHAEGATAEKLIEGESKTRHKEIKEILARLDQPIRSTDQIPLIIGGDFNSPSHLGWNAKTLEWHNGLVVKWPVSEEMENKGFIDSFREIKPDLNYAAPTMSAERISYRIDYIYYKGKAIQAIDSDMHFKYKGVWPSDHPAVTTKIVFKE